MNSKVNGNFEGALLNLIHKLCETKHRADNPELRMFASDLLNQWDKDRGTDWFTKTRKGEAQ